MARTEDTLTDAQKRMLAEVRLAGRKIYNGRARLTVGALEHVGLVEVEYNQVAHAKGGGIQITEQFIVTPPSYGTREVS